MVVLICCGLAGFVVLLGGLQSQTLSFFNLRPHLAGENSTSALLKTFLAAPLPRRNTNLSVDAPLFFIHQRKAGGSSVRAAILDAAQQAGLPFFIPCYGDPVVHCDTYSIGRAPPAAIYGGHLPWAERKELSRRATFDGNIWHNPLNNARCWTGRGRLGLCLLCGEPTAGNQPLGSCLPCRLSLPLPVSYCFASLPVLLVLLPLFAGWPQPFRASHF